jgi:tRNA(fMet)-specific endonuclease VapC
MAKYLIDTNTWIEYFHNRSGVMEHLKEIPAENIYVSEITIAELIYGAVHSRNEEKHLNETYEISETFNVVAISNVLRQYADLRHALVNQNQKNVGDFDILIGATALHYDMIVVTDNIKHFKLMPEIKIENWVSR